MNRYLKTILFLFLFAIAYSCNKIDLSPGNRINAAQGVTYTIKQGNHYCDQNNYQTVQYSELRFLVKFDYTAIYETVFPQNQEDINKLYGFSDNNNQHQQFSARFGWRWSNNALRLFAYIYNDGMETDKELTTINIGTEYSCSIKINSGSYDFTVNGITVTMPRVSTNSIAEGYRLYPYFGGDETAPHDIRIWIKEL